MADTALLLLGVIISIPSYLEVLGQAIDIPLNGRDFPVKEYCDGEKFVGECRDDEVIVITSAWYGRHGIGRCVDGNYGNLGCKSDVISAVDILCSGQQKCEFEIDDDNFKSYEPCPKDFVSHLRVSYACVKVNKPVRTCRGMTSSSQESYDARHIITSSGSTPDVFISSDVTRTTGCGAADFPWILEAPEGQKIGLSMVDFSLNGTKLGSSDALWNPLETGVCLVYASVRDGKEKQGVSRRTSTLCGRLHPRMRHVFTSSSNYIELRILQSDVTGTSASADSSKRPRFLIKYEVVGCSDPPTPRGGWARRLNDNTVAIGCQDHPDQELWRLECEISSWKGHLGNCTSGSPNTGHLVNIQGLPFGLSVALVIAIAFVISCLILLVGICIITRRHSRKRRQQEVQASIYGPQTGTHQPITTNETKLKYHAIKANQLDNMYTDSDSVSKTGQTSGVADLYTLRSEDYGISGGDPRYPGYRRQSGNRSGDYYPTSEHIYEYPTPERMGMHYHRQGSGQSDASSHSVHSGQYFDIDPSQIAGPVAITMPEIPSGVRGPVAKAPCGHARPCTCTGGHSNQESK